MTLKVHSEVRDTTRGQHLVHVQSKEEPERTLAMASYSKVSIQQQVTHTKARWGLGEDGMAGRSALGAQSIHHGHEGAHIKPRPPSSSGAW